MSQYAGMSDADLMAAYKGAKDPFASALAAEGVTGKLADVARSIYQQESGSGANTKTSNAGATGGMQIIPSTFASVADKGWNIADPVQNARAGIRYLKQLDQQSGGDPALTAAGYYGGPGGMEKARRGVAVSDPRNPNAPNTLQYGQQVAARLPQNPLVRGLNAVTDAVMPSAQADTLPGFRGMSDADLMAAYQKAKPATAAAPQPAAPAETTPAQDVAQFGKNAVGGLLRGAGSIGATLARPFETGTENTDRRTRLDTNAAELLGADPNSWVYKGFKLGGEVAGTAGAGPALGIGARLAGASSSIVNALTSAGFSTGAAVAPGLAGTAANLALRTAGGATTGAASAGLIDPSSAKTGALVGGALPGAASLVGYAGNSLGAMLQPFYQKGQERLAGNALREFATNPAAARQSLSNAAEIIPGSSPITATAAGDDGLAALSRSMQNASVEFASGLSARQTAQNQARTTAIEGIAGNTGKIQIAKDARNALTSPMREEVLQAAGNVPSDGILKSIDSLIAKPDNAGKLSQQALSEFRGRIEKFSQDGAINARALYAIRKDINDVLGGKLQGEAGNIRYASGQLTSVKGLIDDAIDLSSRRMPGGSNQLSTAVNAPGVPAINGAASAGTGARPSWRGYLQTYTDQSIPINQMEKLDDILKAVQTGTVDSQGGAILSAAKLNNLMKNQGDDLIKNLSAEQLRILRAVQGDLNAGQIANNTGRAIASNTLQNIAQNNLLQGVLGQALGGSTAASSTLGRLLQVPYGIANKQIQERLGNALLNPKEAARLMADPQTNKILQMLSQKSAIGYKVAPAITSQ